MKNALLISFGIHVGLLSAVPLSSLFKKTSAYPMDVYQVRILSAPEPSASIVDKVEKKTAPKPNAKEKTAETKPKSSKSALPGKGRHAKAEGSFQYNYYLDLISNKIDENWRNPYEGQSGKISAIVYFIIKKDGTLDKIKLDKSSNNYYFDQAALGAVYATRKLPPLPQEFNRDWLGVFFEFEYVQ